MNRNEFIRALRVGLKGLPEAEVPDILADYEAHCEAGMAEGRSEEEIARALGNPLRPARELRLEAGIRNWQTDRSPSSAWSAIAAFIGLATIDILILLPIVLPVLGVLIGLFIAAITMFIAGGFVLIVGPFTSFPGGIAVAIFGGLGVMAASVAAAALLTIVSIAIVNMLLWFGRLHYRVLKPAID